MIRLIKKMDAGPILDQVEVAIDPEDNAASLENRLAIIGAELLEKSLEALQAGTLTETPQDDDEASFAPLLKKEDGLINWEHSALSISNRIRGLNPWPIAYTYLPLDMEGGAVDKVMLRIYSADALDCEKMAAPGTTLSADAKAGLLIACGHGALKIKELQIAGKRRMPATEFLRGHPVHERIRLL
jgi:methionyl-tRNA formyltransferase